MSIETVVNRQYRAIVNKAISTPAGRLENPREGWITTVRKALGMQSVQLAERMRVTKARISQIQKHEKLGQLTMKTLETAAEAMGCKFVYAIVPAKGDISELIEEQARKRALAILTRASVHMSLENQSLNDFQTKQEFERIIRQLENGDLKEIWREDGRAPRRT
jgi:predicted DNA-binding mobile mystery protein A